MAKKKEADTPTADETPTEETPPEETPSAEAQSEVKTEETPEGDAAGEKTAVEQTMEAFLKDEADDLDLDPAVKAVEEVPPEGPEPEKKVEAEPKPVEAPPEVAPSPPAEPKPEEVPPTPAPVEVKPEPTPPVAPVAAPAEPTPEPTPPVAPAPTMEEVRKQYQDNRKGLEATLASTVYNLSEEQVQQLDDGDHAIIPALAARVYMDAVTGATAHMITHLPQMVNDILTAREKTDVLDKQFYDANPSLDKATHGETVHKFGMAYRNLFPNNSAEDFIRDVGAQVLVALRVNPAGNSGTPSTVETVVPKVPAFQPASAGGGKGAAPPPSNVFEVLAEEMNLEELDADL